MLNKKIRKLVRNPNLFFSDMALKQSRNLSKFKVKKKQGHYQYTVVSAVYNVGKYLDDYFKSMVKQRLSFKNNIHLILVDDGSTDNSAEIIKRWEKKYPNNITYLWKENGGQASARNLGLEHVKTEWVTFIDSDDFISEDYFSFVDQALFEDKKIGMLCCNQIYFFEDENKYIDRHPLNYRFKKEKTTLQSKNLDRFMQFSAPLAFFNKKYMSEKLHFDERLKPTFEDGKFVAQYLLDLKDKNVCFYAKPKYFNRKRMDKSSTMDNAWLHKGQYSTVLRNGYLEILKEYKSNLGEIPHFIQRTILWEMLRLVKHIVNKDNVLSFLNEHEKNEFLDLMDLVFSYIDNDVILSFELGTCGFSRQVGMLGCFKNEHPPQQVVYIDKIDSDKKQVLARYFTCSESLEFFSMNGDEIYPINHKSSVRTFLSRTFLIERRMWIPISIGTLNIKINDKQTIINFKGKKYKNNIQITENHFSHSKKNNIWVFMDRDDIAGDNAEFLYKYITKNHSEIDAYFIISKKSADWKRLKNDGVKLINHNSSSHKSILNKCDHVISSHIGNIINPFNDITGDYKITFLQHGATKDDISNWINNCKFDLMITATKGEYSSISDDNNKYIYGKKEIKLTGFPRFDSLIDNNIKIKKQILIMPTWRKNISGTFKSNKTSERVFNNSFQETEYAKKISSLLSNESLINYCHENNVGIIFCPHPNMRPYVKELNISPLIKITSNTQSIHELIKESSILITDYSSVAFDMAYMRKHVCYYQFDENDFFNGGHTYSKGYFDYRKNGFGEVVNNEDSLLIEIKKMLSENNVVSNEINSRIESTFQFHDNKNCQRTYEAITDLNKPSCENFIDLDILLYYAKQASIFNNWPLAESRWKAVSHEMKKPLHINTSLYLNQALREQGKIEEAEHQLKSILTNNLSKHNTNEYISHFALLAMIRQEWIDAKKYWDSIKEIQPIYYVSYLETLANLGMHEKINEFIKNNYNSILQNNSLQISKAWLAYAKNDYLLSINILNNHLEKFSLYDLRNWKPQLLLSCCYRKIGNFDLANSQLINFEKIIKNNIACRTEIALLAYAKHDSKKVINQLNKAYSKYIDMPISLKEIYLESIIKTANLSESIHIAYLFNQIHQDSTFIIKKLGELYLLNKEWSLAENLFNQLTIKGHPQPSLLVFALRMQGKIKDAFNIVKTIRAKEITSFDEINIFAEVCQLAGDWDLATEYWNEILISYGEKVSSTHKEQWRTSLLMKQLSNQNKNSFISKDL
ncbi:MAG: CDP-glycerol glycerophosphotransferase family protein [Plesiomonas sp.]